MQKNLYFRTVLRRSNVLKEFIFDFFFSLCSYPRLLIEVFIKQHFGERYFSFATAITLSIILFVLPAPLYAWVNYNNNGNVASFWVHSLTWYVFLVLFIRQVIIRRREIKQDPSVFDFGKFSLSNGVLTPFMYQFLRRFKTRNIRFQETIFEPLPALVLGIALIIIGQNLGWLLLISSIFYSISYMAAYHKGDNFVMDKIDEMILNEELESSFVEDLDPSKTRGVRIFARKPTAEDLRRKVADSFIESTADEVLEAR